MSPYEWGQRPQIQHKIQRFAVEMAKPASGVGAGVHSGPSGVILFDDVTECWRLSCNQLGTHDSTAVLGYGYKPANAKEQDHPGNGARCRTGHTERILPDSPAGARPRPRAGGNQTLRTNIGRRR